jgi:DNA-binding MarR family transcriptional regulator
VVADRTDDVNALFSIWLVARATTDLLDRALAPSGLTADEYGAYSVLVREGSLTPSQLAEWMAAPATTVSSYLKRFEARGHVRREPNADDRRSSRVRLTAEGRRAHRSAAARFRPALAAVVTALGDDEPLVRQSLLQLRGAVDEVRSRS